MTINPELIFLENLRRNPTTAIGKMTPVDFEALRAEAIEKGLNKVDGWMGTQIRKSIEQVLKHPGHGDQSVHGGKKGKGGTTSASTPASSGGGYNAKQSANLIQNADDSMKRMGDLVTQAGNITNMGLTGATREKASGHIREATKQLKAAKANVDLARQMNGSDRGTVQRNMDAAKTKSQKAYQEVKVAMGLYGMTPRNSKTMKQLDDELATLEFVVSEGLEGGVF